MSGGGSDISCLSLLKACKLPPSTRFRLERCDIAAVELANSRAKVRNKGVAI